jgi:hypothetical protein
VNISIYPDGIVPDLQKRKSAVNAVKVASGTAHGVYGANSHGCIVVGEIPFADSSATVNGKAYLTMWGYIALLRKPVDISGELADRIVRLTARDACSTGETAQGRANGAAG